MLKSWQIQLTAWIVLFVLAGCVAQSQKAAPVATLAAPTPVPATPIPPAPGPTSSPTSTAVPTLTPTATPDLAATQAACKPAAQVVFTSVTDTLTLRPGQVWTCTWQLENVGNCPWESGAQWAWQDGEKFGISTMVPVAPVRVGQAVEVSLTLKVPQVAGIYTSTWALQQRAGKVITTTMLRVNVFAPASVAAATPVPPTAKPIVVASGGPIPPVGEGPFSADESASGPWSCIGVTTAGGAIAEWRGEFFIGVRGGPGNYTISDAEHCRWDAVQQKFACWYAAPVGREVALTLQIGCPGCAQQKVALYGRGVYGRDSAQGECRIQTLIAQTPVPGPAATATAKAALAAGPFAPDEFASGPYNCVRVGEEDWQGEFFIGVRGGPGVYTIDDTEHCQWNAERYGFVCRYVARLGVYVMRNLTVSCPGCTPVSWIKLAGKGEKNPPMQPGSSACWAK